MPYINMPGALKEQQEKHINKLANDFMRNSNISSEDARIRATNLVMGGGDRPVPFSPERIYSLGAEMQQSKFLAGKKFLKTTSDFKTNEETRKTYERINKDFFQKIAEFSKHTGTNKRQTGSQLINNVISLNSFQYEHISNKQANISFGALENAFNAFKKADSFAAFDIETLGGKDIHGHQTLDMMTDFVMNIYDQSGNEIRSHRSAIGIHRHSNMHQQMLEVIHDIETKGFVTGRHEVIGKRLAAIGSLQTKIDYSGPDAVYVAMGDPSKANPSDITSLRRGLDKLLEVGDYQKRGAVDGIRPWERTVIRAMEEIQGQGGSIPMLGQNTINFDQPMMDRVILHQMGPAARRELERKGIGTSFRPDNHLDLLQLTRYMPDSAVRSMYEQKPGALKAITDKGLTMRSQEALAHLFDVSDVTHHMAHADVGVMAKGVTEGKVGNQSFLNYAFQSAKSAERITRSLQLNKNELFLSTQGVGAGFDNKNVLSFVEDAMTGSLRTFGGYEVSSAGVWGEAFGQYGIKKDMTYTIDKIMKLEASEQLAREFAKAHPNMAIKDMVFAKIDPVFDPSAVKAGELVQKYQSPVYLVGSEKDVYEQIQKQLMLIGEGGGTTGKYQPLSGDAGKVVRGMMMRKGYDGKGDMTTGAALAPNEIIAEKSRAAVHESSSALLRDVDRPHQIEGMLNAVNYIESTAKKRGILEKDVMRMMLENSSATSRSVAQDKVVLQNPGIKTFQDLFGHKPFGPGQQRDEHVYRETVDKFLGAHKALYKNKGVARAIINKSKRMAKETGSGRPGEMFYFMNISEALSRELSEEAVTGTVPSMLEQHRTMFYEMDVSGFTGEKDSILRLNLDKPNYNISQQLRRMMGERGQAAKRSPVEDTRMLQRFAEFAAKHEGIELPDKSNTAAWDNAEYMSGIIKDQLAQKRAADPKAGFVKPFTSHNLVSGSIIGDVLTPEEASKRVDNIAKGLPSFRPLTKGSAKIQAQEIANHLFAPPTMDDLLQTGRTRQQAERILQTHEVRRQDFTYVMEDVFSSIQKADMAVFYDPDKRRMIVMDQMGQTADVTRHLPRMTMQDGIYSMQVGETRIMNPMALGMGEGGIRLQSGLRSAYEQHWRMRGYVSRKEAMGEGAKAVDTWMSQYAKLLRESPVLQRGDIKDARSAGFIDISGMYRHLGSMHEEGRFNDVVPEIGTKDDLFYALERINKMEDFDISRMSAEDRLLLGPGNYRALLEAAADPNDTLLQQIIPDIRMGTKASQVQDMLYSFDMPYRIGEAFGSDKRGVMHQAATQMAFIKENAERALAEAGMQDPSLRSIELGRAIDTTFGATMSTRKMAGTFGRATETTITANVLSTPDKLFKEMIGRNLKNIKDPIVRQRLAGLSTLESGAIANPRLADSIFNMRSSLQRVHLKDVYDFSEMTDAIMDGKTFNIADESTARNKMMPRIVVDGQNIQMEYGRGVELKRGQKMITIDQYGAPKGRAAVEGGFARFGFFRTADGQLVDENIIKDIIEKKKIRGTHQQIFDQLLQLEEGGQKIFKGSFYVDPFDLPSNRKMIIGETEKSITDFLFMPAGSDPTVRKVLETYEAEHLIGRVPTQHEMQRIAGRITDSAQREQFEKAFMRERYAGWDALTEILAKEGLSKDDIHFISAHLKEEHKHKEFMGQLNRLASELKARGLRGDQLANELREAFPDARYDKNLGRVISDSQRFSIDGMERIISRHGLAEAGYRQGIGTVTRETVGMIHDPTRMKRMAGDEAFDKHMMEDMIRGMQIDDRGLLTLGSRTYDQQLLTNIRQNIDEESYRELFGHVTDSSGQLRPEMEGKKVAGSVIDMFDRSRFTRPGERVLREADLSGRNLEAFRHLTGRGVQEITESALQDYVALEDSMRAIRINRDAAKNLITDFNENDYVQRTIMGLSVAKDRGVADSVTSIYDETNLLIDLETTNLTKEKLGRKYLALPAYPQKYLTDRHPIAQKPQAELSKLRNMMEGYEFRLSEDGVKRHGAFSPAMRDQALERIQEQIRTVDQSVVDAALSKTGIGSRFMKLEQADSARYKLSLLGMTGSEMEAYKGLKFAGKNMTDFYTAGRLGTEAMPISFSLMPQEFFEENLLKEETLKRVGLTRQEMIEKLSKEGVLGLDYRHPADYQTSLGPTQLYLDQSLPAGQVRSSAAAMIAKAGDADGDTAAFMMLRANAKIIDAEGVTKSEKITFLEHQLYKKSGIQVELEDPNIFKDAHARMMVDANYNRKYQRKLLAGAELEKAFDTELLRKTSAELGIMGKDGFISPSINNRLQEIAQGVAKTNQALAGHMNVPLNRIRALSTQEGLTGIDGRALFESSGTRDAFMQTLVGIQEAYLTSKKLQVQGPEDIMKNIKAVTGFRDALSVAFGEGDNAGRRSAEAFFEWAKSVDLAGRKEMQEMADIAGYTVEDAIKITGETLARLPKTKEFDNMMKLGTMNTVRGDILIQYGITESGLNTVLQHVESGQYETTIRTALETAENSKFIGQAAHDRTLLSDGREWLVKEEGERQLKRRAMMDRAGEAIRKAGNNITGKGLALGAVGIAGAMMATSFIGGNPAAPATNQAQFAHDESLYDIPSLSDEAVMMGGGAPNGYVVNINAETEQGRQQAINAIEQAMAQSYSAANVNISMNIRDTTGNIISDREIERMIQGAFS